MDMTTGNSSTYPVTNLKLLKRINNDNNKAVLVIKARQLRSRVRLTSQARF